MKILSHSLLNHEGIEDGMIRIITDDPDRPNFTYFKDKFSTKTALLAEIQKSINRSKKIKDIKTANLANLEAELKP